MEVCSTVTSKKLSSLAKLILFTIQKVSEASRHKLLTTLDPHLLAKHGKTIRKSLNDAVSTSHSRITCRPSDHDDVRSSFISPVPIQLDYEYNTLPKVRHVAASVFPDVASSTGTMDSCHVDRAAEEFIQRFHRQLRLQRWMMAQEV
ncbi:hypothetical protein Bca101_053313 [Brassica carinata]